MTRFEPRKIEQTPQLKKRVDDFEHGEHVFYRRITFAGLGVLAIGAAVGEPGIMLAGGVGAALGALRTNSKAT